MTIDFDKIKSDYPLPDVMRQSGFKLIKNGPEYKCLCCFHNDHDPSLTVYQKAGKPWRYICFSCHASGDVVTFVKERYGLANNKEAVEYLTGEIKASPAPIQRQADEAKDPYEGMTYHKAPPHHEPIVAGQRTPRILNPKRGNKLVTYNPSAVYPYTNKMGDLYGYVVRFEIDGKKITPGVWWMKGNGFEGWSNGRFKAPRPLYRLKALADNPDKPVLIVEGEKCADFAARILQDINFVAASWMGGTKAQVIASTYWKSLAGRTVYIWPDNDDVGRIAAENIVNIIKDYCEEIYVLDTKAMDRPEKWDVADIGDISQADLERAIKKFQRFGLKEAKEVIQQADEAPLINAGNFGAYLKRSEKTGEPLKNSIKNAALYLEYHRDFSGLFRHDRFSNMPMVTRRPPWSVNGEYPRALTDNDITSVQLELEDLGMTAKRGDIGALIMTIAERHSMDPVGDRLRSLEWDGVPRLFGGLSDGGDTIAPWTVEYLGAPDTPEASIFGGKWMIGAAARALQPGCKMDTMLILEGPQGLKKSTALKVLSNALMPHLFTDDMDKPNSKDAAMQMQGRLIIEISELASLTKTEVEHVKSWLSRTADRFRLPFGKIVQEFPRTCVFAGTHNPIEGVGYLKDPTGARRFWPVRCTNIDIRALQRDGEQLWAEAVHRYNAGEIWWLSSEDEHKTALQAQSSRAEHDPYADMINEFIIGRTVASINQIMTALEIPKERRSSMTSKRISGYMGSIGWKAGTEGGRLTFYSPDHRDLYAAE